MDQKIGAKKFIPLILSVVGIMLWAVARIVREDCIDFMDIIMFTLSLTLPVLALILSKSPCPAKTRRFVAIVSLIVAIAQVAFAAVYYYVFVVVGGGPGLEIIPGATLFVSIAGMIHGYLINLIYMFAAITFIGSSAACWFVLRTPKTPEEPPA